MEYAMLIGMSTLPYAGPPRPMPDSLIRFEGFFSGPTHNRQATPSELPPLYAKTHASQNAFIDAYTKRECTTGQFICNPIQ